MEATQEILVSVVVFIGQVGPDPTRSAPNLIANSRG